MKRLLLIPLFVLVFAACQSQPVVTPGDSPINGDQTEDTGLDSSDSASEDSNDDADDNDSNDDDASKDDKNTNNEAQNIEFQNHPEYGFYGSLTAEGYIQLERRECEPGDMCGETVDYVSFVITKNDNEVLAEFLGDNAGNSFAGENLIGLGCFQPQDSRIFSQNASDADNMADTIISGDDFTKLMATNQSNVLTLEMYRPIYTGGRGAPDCYSHFRDFEVK